MDKQVKRHKNIARLVAILGILPGGWFVFATRTELGTKLDIQCGYWVIALVILTAIWIMYAILTKILTKDIGLAHQHAQSLNEQRHYKMLYASTIIEAFMASVIFALSLIGFLLTDMRCFLEKVV